MQNVPLMLAAVFNLEETMSQIASAIWGLPLIALLIGTHIFLTIRLGFIQRYVPRGIKMTFQRKQDGPGDVSQFGSLMTALAATIGTGNIIGVATAVSVGGAGAVFWMWMTGIFGIATKYGEAVLSVKYRVQNPDGTWAGGPMYVLEKGLGQKWLGVIFAIFTMIAGFGIGCMTQANSIVGNMQSFFTPEHEKTVALGIGITLSLLTGLVIIGGVKSIARVCSYLVPIMAIGYVIGCAAILVHNYEVLGDTVKLICTSAFTGTAAVGGFVGAGVREAMRYGIARGLFSNESGLGSAPIVSAAAKSRNPIQQGLVSCTATFWDTVVVCAMTGLVVVSSGHWQEGLKAGALTQAAFGELHIFGPIILTFGLLTFVFSTILGWSYYGERAAEYLFGQKAILPYRICWVIAVFIGSVLPLSVVWHFSDAANGLMAIPNLIALICLSGVIVSETKKYKYELKGEKAPDAADS